MTRDLRSGRAETNALREVWIEAAKLARERRVPLPRTSQDLDPTESTLRRWRRKAAAAPPSAFPGHGRPRAALAEIAALKKEVSELKPAPDILKKGRNWSAMGPSASGDAFPVRPGT